MSTSKSNAPVVSEKATDLLARRDRLIAELEKVANASTGTLQQVLQKMSVLIGGTRPGLTLNADSCRDISESFLRFSQDPAAPRTPPILMEAMEWVQAYLVAVSSSTPRQAPAGVSAAPAASAATTRRGGNKDGFESVSSQKVRTLTGDVPAPTARSNSTADQQQQLESFKTWMKNPGLGKLKG